jgi:thioredoxin-like negative regulator of GroEL
VHTYYEKYGFDKDAGKLISPKEKLTKDQEHGMLKDFLAHHKLEHRVVTLNQEDRKKVYGDYKVRGIPTAVLIDRAGNVRLVKVGSGKANADAIEEMIKKLLAEK